MIKPYVTYTGVLYNVSETLKFFILIVKKDSGLPLPSAKVHEKLPIQNFENMFFNTNYSSRRDSILSMI